MSDATRSQQPQLLDEVRNVLGLHVLHSYRAFLWGVDHTVCPVSRHAVGEDLYPTEPKIEAFLTDLAAHGDVAALTQNQKMNALVFLYKRVFTYALRCCHHYILHPRPAAGRPGVPSPLDDLRV
jgi:hypothetical protein